MVETTDAPKPLNQIEQLRALLDEAVKVSEDHLMEVCAASNTLVGPRGQDQEKGVELPGECGLVPPLKDKVHDILANLARASGEVQRIMAELS